VSLTSGTTYTLGYLIPGESLASDTNTLFINYPTLTTASTVTVANQSRFFGTGSLLSPTGSFVAGPSFRGGVKAQFASPAVPEPGTAFAGVMLAGLLGVRRRRA
jgi:MYXO-CTERM domain-containing protein